MYVIQPQTTTMSLYSKVFFLLVLLRQEENTVWKDTDLEKGLNSISVVLILNKTD